MLVNAVDVELSPSAGSVLDAQEDYLEALEGWFGPYPFASAGAVVMGLPMDGPLASLGGPIALDTQTRPVYLSGSTGPPRQALIHELAHQWAGNSVTPATWQDHWLNEAFATYAQWLWAESTGASIDAVARQNYEGFLRRADDPAIPPAATGPENLFADSVYVRGAMVMHLLRDQMGDDDFFAFVQAWMADNAHSTVTTQLFMDTAQAYAVDDLQEIFDTWLFEPTPPGLDP